MSEEQTIYRVSTDGDGPPEAARPLAPLGALADARARAADLEYRLQAAHVKIRNQATEIGTQQRRIFLLEQRLAQAERRLQGGRR